MTKRIIAVILAFLMLFCLSSCSLFQKVTIPKIDESQLDFENQLSPAEIGEEIAVVTTSLGSFKLKFFPEYAPKAVENFVTLAKEGHYDGTYVFCIDPQNKNTLMGGSKDNQGIEYKSIFNDGESFDNEYTDALWHFSGAVSAISTEMGKSDSRFLIVGNTEVSEKAIKSMQRYGFPESLIEQYRQNGGIPAFDKRYTIFAQVFEGMETINAINNLEVDAKTGNPLEDFIIEKIEIITYGDEK